jgi:hypothetical protein
MFNLKSHVSGLSKTWKHFQWALPLPSSKIVQLDIGGEFAPLDGRHYSLFYSSQPEMIAAVPDLNDFSIPLSYEMADRSNLLPLEHWAITNYELYVSCIRFSVLS